jgi:hypothetical protein
MDTLAKESRSLEHGVFRVRLSSCKPLPLSFLLQLFRLEYRVVYSRLGPF